MNWINAKEIVPSREFPILIWGEFMEMPISVEWKEDGTYGEPGFFEAGDEYCTKEENISHWMPLPKPPKV
jgi:hypothetical protein